MTAADRRGFTLTELLVVTVLGALVLAASLQILITNQRTYTAQNAQIRGQQNTRAALDILTAEIREISPSGGDLIGMGATAMSVRVMRKLGVGCSVDYGSTPSVVAIRVGDAFAKGDSVFVFADNDEDIRSDDTWIPAVVTSVDTTEFCGSNPAMEIDFAGQGAAFAADSVRSGAPVRSFVHYTYGLYTIDGETYLGREGRDGNPPVPLVGPLKPSGGLEFVYLDAEGNTTTVSTDVRQVAVKLRTHSGALNSLGEIVSDSISAWIYTRN